MLGLLVNWNGESWKVLAVRTRAAGKLGATVRKFHHRAREPDAQPKSRTPHRCATKSTLWSAGLSQFVANAAPKSQTRSYLPESGHSFFAIHELVFPSEGRIDVDSQPWASSLGSVSLGVRGSSQSLKAFDDIDTRAVKSLLWSKFSSFRGKGVCWTP